LVQRLLTLFALPVVWSPTLSAANLATLFFCSFDCSGAAEFSK
jgi:hypothetical protein